MKLSSKIAFFLLVLSILSFQSVFAMRYKLYDLGEDMTPQLMNENGQVVTYEYSGSDYNYYLWDKNSGYTPIHAPGGYSLSISDLNNNGMVVGTLYGDNDETRPFVWDSTHGLQDIFVPSQESHGISINDNNQVIGDYYLYSLSRPCGFIFDVSSGEFTDIDSFYWTKTSPQAITNSGVVYGSRLDEVYNMFKYDSENGLQEFGLPPYTPGGRTATFTEVNDSGQGTGYYEKYTAERAFYYSDTTGFIEVYVPYHYDYYTYSVDINNSGQLLGSYYDDDTGEGGAFIWEYREPYPDFIMLNTPGEGNMMPEDINNVGQVIGFIENPITYEYQAILWENGIIMSIDSLVSDVRWSFVFANAINDDGQIIGKGRKDGNAHGYYTELYEEWIYIQSAASAFGFTEADIDNLFDLYHTQSTAPIIIGNDEWYYTDKEFVGRSIGEGWSEDDYKYIYLGSGVTTNPNYAYGAGTSVPEPVSIILMITGLLSLIIKKYK